MVTVVGIRFKKAGKIYYFDPDGIDLKAGNFAIVETSRGLEFGEVVINPKQIPEEEVVRPKVIRAATEEDCQQVLENRQNEEEAFAFV